MDDVLWKPIVMTLRLCFYRFNLNVDGSKDDADIWRVLEVVQMKETVLELPKKLGLFYLL